MIRVGVIGIGVMGAGHARFINNYIPNAEVIGISDINIEGMQLLANELKSIKFQSKNPEEIVQNPEVDALLIASPDQFHAEQIRLALKYKKPTLCEKPLASTLVDARNIAKEIDEAEAALGKKLINIGFMAI